MCSIWNHMSFPITQCCKSISAGGSKKNLRMTVFFSILFFDRELYNFTFSFVLSWNCCSLFHFFVSPHTYISYNTSVILPNIFYCYWNNPILIWNLSEKDLLLNKKKPFELFIELQLFTFDWFSKHVHNEHILFQEIREKKFIWNFFSTLIMKILWNVIVGNVVMKSYWYAVCSTGSRNIVQKCWLLHI